MNYQNRGMLAETIINQTLDFYRQHKIALFHKKIVPIAFSGVKKGQNQQLQIKKGWIKHKSTTDYYGVYQGKFVAFEVKSINNLNFPLQNIKAHQWKYLKLINSYQGLAFLLIYFVIKEKFIFLNFVSLSKIKAKTLSYSEAQKIGTELAIIFPGKIDFIKCL